MDASLSVWTELAPDVRGLLALLQGPDDPRHLLARLVPRDLDAMDLVAPQREDHPSLLLGLRPDLQIHASPPEA